MKPACKLEDPRERVTLPELSEDPLSISPAVILAFPFASNWTVMSLVTTVGAVVSTTFTVLVTSVAAFPAASETL